MTDTISLKRIVDGEFAPQYWTMNGGDFAAMLAAVKALPFRKWQDGDRAWLVKFDGVTALRDAGYHITRNADVRIDLVLGSESIEQLETGSNVEIRLNYRKVGDGDNWSQMSKLKMSLHFEFTADEIAKLAAEEAADEITQKNISKRNMAQYCQESAIRKLSNRAIRDLEEQARAIYAQQRGKRTKEDHEAAIKSVWQFIETRNVAAPVEQPQQAEDHGSSSAAVVRKPRTKKALSPELVALMLPEGQTVRLVRGQLKIVERNEMTKQKEQLKTDANFYASIQLAIRTHARVFERRTSLTQPQVGEREPAMLESLTAEKQAMYVRGKACFR